MVADPPAATRFFSPGAPQLVSARSLKNANILASGGVVLELEKDATIGLALSLPDLGILYK